MQHLSLELLSENYARSQTLQAVDGSIQEDELRRLLKNMFVYLEGVLDGVAGTTAETLFEEKLAKQDKNELIILDPSGNRMPSDCLLRCTNV